MRHFDKDGNFIENLPIEQEESESNLKILNTAIFTKKILKRQD